MKGLTPLNVIIIKIPMILLFTFMMMPAQYATPARASALEARLDKGVKQFFHNLQSNPKADDRLVATALQPTRHDLTGIAPDHRGPESNNPGPTEETFSDADWGLTKWFWKQHLLDTRLALVAGFLDAIENVDCYGIVNPWSNYSNLAFSTIPTVPIPDPGLGIAVRLLASDQFYVVGGLADANYDTSVPGERVNSFFTHSEYFKHIEVGWISSFQNRFDNNINLSAWHADDLKQALVESGWGLAFSANRLINDTWLPFVHAGYSDGGGALLEASVSAGIEFYFNESDGAIGFGLNWGRPPDSELGDQVAAELFNRLQLSEKLVLTTNLQWTRNPASDPEQNQEWVLGIQANMDF